MPGAASRCWSSSSSRRRSYPSRCIPDDEYARQVENSRGKTEMWHILAAEPRLDDRARISANRDRAAVAWLNR